MANVFKQYRDSKISANVLSEGITSPTADLIPAIIDTTEEISTAMTSKCGKSHLFPCSGCGTPCQPRLSDEDLIR
jgi:hypothetical protein